MNVYTYSTAKSPKAAESQCEAVGYVIEFPTARGDASAGELLTVRGMTCYQSELYILEKALRRMNTMCELHIYTECGYVAAGFGKWLAGWQTKRKEPVRNAGEWKALDALVQQYGHVLVFHVKEEHSYRNWFRDNLEKKKCLEKHNNH